MIIGIDNQYPYDDSINVNNLLKFHDRCLVNSDVETLCAAFFGEEWHNVVPDDFVGSFIESIVHTVLSEHNVDHTWHPRGATRFPDFLFPDGNFLEIKTDNTGTESAITVFKWSTFIDCLYNNIDNEAPIRLWTDILVIRYENSPNGLYATNTCLGKLWDLIACDENGHIYGSSMRGLLYLKDTIFDKTYMPSFYDVYDFLCACAYIIENDKESPYYQKSRHWLRTVANNLQLNYQDFHY